MQTRNLLKHFLQLFLPISVVFGLIVVYLYSAEIEKGRAERESNEVLRISLAKHVIEKDLEASITDLRVLSQHKEFDKIDAQLSPETLEHLAQDFLGFAQNKQHYDQIRFLSDTGKEVVRINFGSGHPYIVPKDQLQDKSWRYYFTDALRLKAGEISVSIFDLNFEHKKVERPVKPVIRLATPVLYGQGKYRGIVVLNYRGSNLIRNFKQKAAGLEDQLMLLEMDGFWLHAPRTEWEWGFILSHGFTFKKQFPKTWERISNASSGHFYNDKGLFTFATVYPRRLALQASTGATLADETSRSQTNDKEYHWKAVAHVRSGILESASTAIAIRQAPLSALVFGLLAIGCWWLARARILRLGVEQALLRRVGQQAAVAELGQRALSGVGLGALMDTIVEYVAQVLKVEYCKVLELLPDGEALLLRAGSGWHQGLVGRATVATGMASQAGYTLACKEPVIVEDLRQETRFTGPQLLHDHKVVSGMSVIIQGVDRPFGVLAVHTRKRRVFTKDDVHFLQAVANILSEVIELESAQSKTRLQTSALNAVADGIVITDRDGNIQWVNPAFTQLTGYNSDEIVGQNPRILKSGKQDRAFYKKLWDTILAGKTWQAELWNKRKDGSLYLGEESITPVLDQDGEIGHFIAIKRDITERQQLQRQLQQAQKMEAMGQLTGGIAHDFNNILSSVLGFTELAREALAQYNNEQIEGYISEVYKSGIRARDLVAQMLAFSRGGEGELKPLMLQPLIKESLKMLGAMFPSSIEVDLQLDGDDLPVMTNPVQLHQMVMNLCINARDAMEGQGHITIGLQRVTCPAGEHSVVTECCACHERVIGDYIQLSVRDSGSGIQPEQLDRLFDPFYTTKDVGKGTGMGLSMVHGIIHDHGGHIIVETELGKGSTFALLFPEIDAQVDTVNMEDNDTNVSSSQTFDGHILIVDDEASVGYFIGELMKSRGCKVTVETDSPSALSRFKENPKAFDLVVTDQTMPGMTGVELAQSLIAIRPELPVVLCTGYSDHIDEAKAKSLGISGYVNKPIETDEFLKLVRELLQAK